jgi:hypothetical protein
MTQQLTSVFHPHGVLPRRKLQRQKMMRADRGANININTIFAK